MIKTIKVKKQLRLDELIKYAFDKELEQVSFNSDNGGIVSFDKFGRFNALDHSIINPTSTFTVEIEEEITDDTVFDYLFEIAKEGEFYDHGYNVCISDVKNEESLRIYAGIDKKIEMVWERK